MSSRTKKKSSSLSQCCGCGPEEEEEEFTPLQPSQPQPQPQPRPGRPEPLPPSSSNGWEPTIIPNRVVTGNKYQRVKQQYLGSNTLFEDPEFPADYTMLSREGPTRNVRWLRPKEISARPVYFHRKRDYYDMDQAELGDCWFISAVVCLASSPQKELLSNVVPSDQGFEDNEYCGAFRFYFWRYGKWTEVVIDDRLPTQNGQLIYSSNRENPEEYWTPLVEKAYAKFNGSYEAINGGFVTTSLVDMTGGIGELMDLREKKMSASELADLLLKVQTMNSILGAGINPKQGAELARYQRRGLGDRHAYSILKVQEVIRPRGKTTILHIRNPWGNTEWNGAWADGSPEWNTLSEEDKQRTVRIKNDGEFWMSIDDFIQYFDMLFMCHLTPDGLSEEVADNLNKSKWKMTEHYGSWVYGITAGGPVVTIPPTANFWTNPQYELSLSRNSKPTTVVISLMEVESMNDKRVPDIAISFGVFEFKRGVKAQRVTANNYYQLIADYKLITMYRSYREETVRYVLNPVDHIIVPNTYSYGQEADFYLRIFDEEEFTSRPIELFSSPGLTKEGAVFATQPTAMDVQDVRNQAIDSAYDAYAGSDGINDAKDLYGVLGAGHEAIGQPRGICNLDTCRNLMFLADTPRPNGALNKLSIFKIWTNVQNWRDAFGEFDIDNNKTINVSELPKVYQRLDIHLGDEAMRVLLKRYGGKDNRITEDNFLQSVSRILQLYRMYQKLSFEGKLKMPVEEWLAVGLAI